jgi:hypothetical protein
MIEEHSGGQARLSKDDYIEGAPELVAEIAASSAAIDLGDKKRAYRRNAAKGFKSAKRLDGACKTITAILNCGRFCCRFNIFLGMKVSTAEK